MGVLLAILLLLAARGLSAQQTTADPFLSDSSPNTLLEKGSMVDPVLLGAHRPCESADRHFCLNGGTCLYPQDHTKPFCICPTGSSGNRCHLQSFSRGYHLAVEHLIGVSCGAAFLVFSLSFLVCCVVRRRRTKSKQIQSKPSDITV
nr:epigen-like [Nerophis lumbriciformis]